MAGRRLVTSSHRRGICLRKLVARLRGAPVPAAAGRASSQCVHCRLPLNNCLCRDETVPVSIYLYLYFLLFSQISQSQWRTFKFNTNAAPLSCQRNENNSLPQAVFKFTTISVQSGVVPLCCTGFLY